MSEGQGGFWNRAGRRSGGYAPRAFDIVLPLVCEHCGEETPPALVVKRLTIGSPSIERGYCPKCNVKMWERPYE